MVTLGVIIAVSLFTVSLVVAFSAKGQARTTVYCTKHVYAGSALREVWGTHRTPGPACDGPQHRHVPSWW